MSLPSPEEVVEILKEDPIEGMKIIKGIIADVPDDMTRTGMMALFQLVVTVKVLSGALAMYMQNDDPKEFASVIADLSLELEESVRGLVAER